MRDMDTQTTIEPKNKHSCGHWPAIIYFGTENFPFNLCWARINSLKIDTLSIQFSLPPSISYWSCHSFSAYRWMGMGNIIKNAYESIRGNNSAVSSKHQAPASAEKIIEKLYFFYRFRFLFTFILLLLLYLWQWTVTKVNRIEGATRSYVHM